MYSCIHVYFVLDMYKIVYKRLANIKHLVTKHTAKLVTTEHLQTLW